MTLLEDEGFFPFATSKAWEIEEYNIDNEELYKLQNKVGRIATLMNPMTYIAINTALIVLVYIGAKQTTAGVILQGQVIALVNYMSQILLVLIL